MPYCARKYPLGWPTFMTTIFFLITGPTVISWKKSDPSGVTYHFLATGNHLHTNDERINLTDVNDHGSTLVIQVNHSNIIDTY